MRVCVDIMDGVAASLGDDDGLDRTVSLIERALPVLCSVYSADSIYELDVGVSSLLAVCLKSGTKHELVLFCTNKRA